MKQHLQSNKKKKSNNNVSIVESEEHRELQRNVSVFFYKLKVGVKVPTASNKDARSRDSEGR